MKNIKNIISLFVFVLMSLTVVFAGPAKDTENVADGLLFFGPTAKFSGYYGWIAPDTNGVVSWRYANFTLDNKARITQLNIDGTEVPIPAGMSLPGIPVGKVAMENFYIGVNSLDYAGRTKASGSFNTSVLMKDTVIKIVLSPGTVYKTVKYTPPMGVDPSTIRMETDNGWSFGYNQYHGTFDVWIDSTSEPMGYKIYVPGTGVVLSVGIISPHGDAIVSNDKAVNTVYEGGVSEAYFDWNEQAGAYEYSKALMDVTADGVIDDIAVKAVVTDGFGGTIRMMVSDAEAKVIVKAWYEDVGLTEIPATVVQKEYWAQWVEFKAGKALIIIKPSGKSSFSIQLLREGNTPTPKG